MSSKRLKEEQRAVIIKLMDDVAVFMEGSVTKQTSDRAGVSQFQVAVIRRARGLTVGRMLLREEQATLKRLTGKINVHSLMVDGSLDRCSTVNPVHLTILVLLNELDLLLLSEYPKLVNIDPLVERLNVLFNTVKAKEAITAEAILPGIKFKGDARDD